MTKQLSTPVPDNHLEVTERCDPAKSISAARSPSARRELIYSIAAMLIFCTLPCNLSRIEFSRMLLNVLTGSSLANLSVPESVTKYGESARNKLKPLFKSAGVSYPPTQIAMIGLKDEKLLILFAKSSDGKWKQITGYPVIGTSGKAGPKLKEGDLQIPEGFYNITQLYPNSIAHLGLRVNYPNAQDRARARIDRRTKLGGDILIHGSFWSTGCLAMGNEAIEDLYILVHDTGCKNVQLILSPCDLRTKQPDIDFKKHPAWVPTMYKEIRLALKNFPMVIDAAWSSMVPSDD
ncbi:MAG: L,D-transpeptidase family protein [Candidatus Obscuribacterales bacterium]|nr:L,D-transpeptidase family protein [Candidatus Obscuribacterales bacterium]